jgi:lipopolysaccharide export system protein LptA
MNFSRLVTFTGLAALSAVAVVAVSQSGGVKLVFRDKQRNMEVYDATSWNVSFVEPYNFRGRGSPIIARWQDEGVEIRANSIDGVATLAEQGQLTLASANISGNLRVTINRPSSNPQSNQRQTIVLTSQSATYDGRANQVRLSGGVRISGNDPGAQRTLDLSSQSAVVTLSPPGSRGDAVRTARLDGGVNGTVVIVQPGNQRANGKVSASQATYDAEKRTIVLSGNVRMDAEDASFLGQVQASLAILRLNDRGEVVELDLQGPGESSVKPAP